MPITADKHVKTATILPKKNNRAWIKVSWLYVYHNN